MPTWTTTSLHRAKPDLVLIFVQMLGECTNVQGKGYVLPDFAIPTTWWQQLQANTRAHSQRELVCLLNDDSTAVKLQTKCGAAYGSSEKKTPDQEIEAMASNDQSQRCMLWIFKEMFTSRIAGICRSIRVCRSTNMASVRDVQPD